MDTGILSPALMGMDPSTQGILAAGFGALDASGPSRMPVSFGQVIGRGGMAGLGAYNSALNSLRNLAQTQAIIELEQDKGKLLKIQIEAAARKEAFAQKLLEQYAQRRGLSGGIAPSGPMPGPMLAPPSSPVMTNPGARAPFGAPMGGGQPAPSAPPMGPAAPMGPAGGGSPLAPGGGSGFNLSPEDAFMMKLGGVGDFTELTKLLNTPQNAPAGGYSRIGPDGPMSYMPDPTKGVTMGPNGVQLMPGADATLSRLASIDALAKEGAKDVYAAPIPVDTPRGKFALSPAQYREYSRSGVLPADATPTPASAGTPAPAAGPMSPVSQPGPRPLLPPARPVIRKPGELQGEPEQKGGIVTAEELAKRKVNQPIAAAAIRESYAALDRLKNAAQELQKSDSLGRITGLMSKAPNLYGSGASDAAAKLEFLKSNIGTAVLQAMREASKTGGAVGSVSEGEWRMLQSNLAALDTKQSEASFRTELQRIIDHAIGAKGRLRKGFAETYGNDAAREFKLNADELMGTY